MKRTRWRAFSDEIAHAFVASAFRALCGERNQPERFDRPARVRCAVCLVREAQLEEARKRFVTS